MKTYYDILGVSRDATQAQIKAAYRKLAKKYHPDSSTGSEEDKRRFQEIQEAYSVLSDPKRRETYHYYGHEAFRKSYYAQHGEAGGFDHDHGGHCKDCQGDHGTKEGHCGACEEGRTHPKEEEGPPPYSIRIAVRLELSETLRTVKKTARYMERVEKPGSGPRHRYEEKEWVFQVEIPRGAYENQYFMLEDVICEGEKFWEHIKSRGMEQRYVVIVLLNEKPGFVRQGYHLYTDQEVDYHTLALGGRIRIRTLDGTHEVELPPGTDTGKRLCIKNQGLIRPKRIGGRGDLHVTLHVRVPKNLTDEQRRVLELLKEVMEKTDTKEGES